MQQKVKRSELDQLAKFYSLDERGVDVLFEVAEARPTRAEGLRFLANCLRIAGILSLASAMVFFVAANWSRIGIFGRFILVEILLVACAAVALWKPPPSSAGRGALFLAFIATGVLLALFGQTYQTGADVYELFLTWTLLGLPLVMLARWSVASAAWVLVLNAMLLLYCGWQPAGGMLWALLGQSHFSPARILLAACWVNLALWFLAEWRHSPAVPEWVGRILMSAAFGFCTWAGIVGLYTRDLQSYETRADLLAVLITLVTMAVVAYLAWQRKSIYPLAVVLGSFIAFGLAAVTKLTDQANEGMFLMGAAWLIASSTLGGRLLLQLMRQWRTEARA